MNFKPLIFTFLFFLVTCDSREVKIEKFSLCRQLQQAQTEPDTQQCIPPLLLNEVTYYFSNPNLSSTMHDYIFSLRETRQSLAFCAQLNAPLSKQQLMLWQTHLRAGYFLLPDKLRFEFDSVLFSKRSFCSSILLSDLLEKKYPQAALSSYMQPSPLPIAIELFWQQDGEKKLLLKRTLIVKISHEVK